MSALKEVKRTLAVVTNRKKPIGDHDDFVHDLGMDSLDVAEVIAMLEEHAQVGAERWDAWFMRLVMANFETGGEGVRLTPKKVADYLDSQKESA